jgi:hypothetical protein
MVKQIRLESEQEPEPPKSHNIFFTQDGDV